MGNGDSTDAASKLDSAVRNFVASPLEHDSYLRGGWSLVALLREEMDDGGGESASRVAAHPGVVGGLITVLHDGDSVEKSNAALVLGRIMKVSPAAAQEAAWRGALHLLVAMLTPKPAATGESARTHDHGAANAASALKSLLLLANPVSSENEARKATFPAASLVQEAIRCGVLDRLDGLLKHGTYRARAAAAATMAQLFRICPSVAAEETWSGVANELLIVLKDGSDRDKGAAAWALARLFQAVPALAERPSRSRSGLLEQLIALLIPKPQTVGCSHASFSAIVHGPVDTAPTLDRCTANVALALSKVLLIAPDAVEEVACLGLLDGLLDGLLLLLKCGTDCGKSNAAGVLALTFTAMPSTVATATNRGVLDGLLAQLHAGHPIANSRAALALACLFENVPASAEQALSRDRGLVDGLLAVVRDCDSADRDNGSGNGVVALCQLFAVVPACAGQAEERGAVALIGKADSDASRLALALIQENAKRRARSASFRTDSTKQLAISEPLPVSVLQ